MHTQKIKLHRHPTSNNIPQHVQICAWSRQLHIEKKREPEIVKFFLIAAMTLDHMFAHTLKETLPS